MTNTFLRGSIPLPSAILYLGFMPDDIMGKLKDRIRKRRERLERIRAREEWQRAEAALREQLADQRSTIMLHYVT